MANIQPSLPNKLQFRIYYIYGFKMADKKCRSQGKRIPYDILNNLSSVDLFYEGKGKKKASPKKILGIYQAERLIARKQDADVSKTVLH